MRPIGEIRWMVEAQFACSVDVPMPSPCFDVAPEAITEPVGLTWRDVADAVEPLGVSRSAARHTVKNMARSGALEPVGARAVGDSARPLVAFRLAGAPVPSALQRARRESSAAAAALVQAMNSWATFV